MGKVQFIVVSDLSDLTSVRTKKVARKHSAREAHARERRTRTVNFQTRHRHFKQPLPNAIQAVLSTGRDDSELLLPSPVDLVSAHRNDPFDTFALPMGRKEQLLFDHYVMTAIPCLNANCNKYLGLKDYADTMTREWIRLAITDSGFIYGVFLSSCRHLSQSFKDDPIEGEQHYMQLATEYKLACLRTVINALPTVQSTLQVDYTTIAKAMLLGLDEIWMSNYGAMRWHLFGAIKLVNLAGGPEVLGRDGFLFCIFVQICKATGMADLATMWTPPTLGNLIA
ncbi:unnamed protein product [Clonostachys byssicola]|uniref:Uncharacterized protein n=1 Tax=Clonostachys byssicola TaxID=160290 RepID=A0A9N9UT73_9HYPO|nr:unnamed protein product [Clonostachys byssicola]